jgi:hypothetical protein
MREQAKPEKYLSAFFRAEQPDERPCGHARVPFSNATGSGGRGGKGDEGK